MTHDISNAFFDTIAEVSNMRYFKVQEYSLDYADDEREIDKTLYNEVCSGLHLDFVDPTLNNLQHRWFQDDMRAGVVEGAMIPHKCFL